MYMKAILFFSICMGCIRLGIAQVGIGNTEPQATLDITATNAATPSNEDGILIPRIDDFPSPPPTESQDGMMVFATGNGSPTKGFYYWNNTTTTWISVGGAVDTQNTLNQAYDEGGAGAGRVITADAGAVLIEGMDGFQNTGTYGVGAILSLSGAGTKMFFYPRKSAFRAGRTTSTQWDDTSIGDYSTAIGLNNVASSFGGTSLGSNNTASGTNASTAFGYGNTASGNYATAFGYGSLATADYATAFGDGADASGVNSTAFGDGTEASGLRSTAFGINAIASGDYATAFGSISEATGNYATAFGNRTDATASYSTAFGSFSIASGDTATAFGTSSTASGTTSTAFGSGSTASGANSTAFGTSTASGVYAISFGRSVEARSYSELAVGVYNNLSTPVNPNSFNASDKIFSIGNGTSAVARSNALTIYKDGRININDAYTLPTTDGTASQVLTTNGAGVTFWTSPTEETTTSIVRIILNSSQLLPNGATKIMFDTTVFDTNSDFDTTNNRFVAPRDGYYRVNCALGANNYPEPAGSLYATIYKNGALYQRDNFSVSANAQHKTIDGVVELNAGEYIEIVAIASPANYLVSSSNVYTFFEVQEIK
ncbi:hypothetical protein [Constantimarinum furrinae]|uniref:hypothetical protein n=1 Tax=Constantimarinum furrinae TaxID=2562285 RepID=UPI00164B0BB9|nr:hypothetical protein [Constantimarinum furrinae]